ncbi:hypothetical protein U9M48_001551 [Paspalum notatum var. saurae]|uniref:Uncharacterized protein n=1 Tax=Paspalum notatum var. saurae TaxID=547442 RepID=A0AAQ3SFA8_PASNO
MPTLASSSTASCSPPEATHNHPSKRAKTSTEARLDTCDAKPTRGNPPPFLEELEILFGMNTQARGVLLSAGGVHTTNDTFATPQPIYQSSDRSRPKRSLREQSMDSPQKKTSIEECLRDISYAVTRHSHGQKSNNYDVVEHTHVREILAADGIPEGSQAMYLCRTAIKRMEFFHHTSKEGRKRWIQFNWGQQIDLGVNGSADALSGRRLPRSVFGLCCLFVFLFPVFPYVLHIPLAAM